MPKFYETKEFSKLYQRWKELLAEEGFADIEDRQERLKQPNPRTIAFQHKEEIHNFYRKLDAYLTNNVIPDHHREVLELYAEGVHLKGKDGIVERTGQPLITVRRCIDKYKALILQSD